MVMDARVNVRVRGAGRAVPAGPAVSNVDLLSLDPGMKSRDAAFLAELGSRIESKFGVSERYLAHRPWLHQPARGETSEDLAFEALRIATGQCPSKSPSLLIHGTTTSSRYTGSQAAAILGRLGVVAPAYDIKAGCSTSLASLHMAAAFLRAGYSDVAVACAETLSRVMHPDVRETWFGLADGGAALWLAQDEEAPEFAITKSLFSTDGRHVDLYTTRGLLPPTQDEVRANGYCLQGDGEQMGTLARARYAAMIDELFSCDFPLSSVDWIIPHQVNRAIVDDVLRPYDVRAKVVWDAREFGNLGGASVLFSLARCLEQGAFSAHDRILLISVGGGLSSAAQVWEKL
jgi:3-oxoacyl-[acyl-carrier-protein] synthase III